MVVFEDGLPKRQDYRKFQITGVAGQDDFASMHEMLRRRFTPAAGGAGAPDRRSAARRFSYPPALVVVDGGRGQLTQASEVLAELGLSIPHIGLAKRLEEVYFPDRPDPLRDPARLRGVVRAAAHPRRGAPHRGRLPPVAPREARAALAARRHPRRRPRAEEGPAQAVRVAREAAAAASIEELAATPGVGPAMAATDLRAPARTAGRHGRGERVSSEVDRGPGLHDHHRPVGCRAFGGRALARGPRVLRRRQPAAGAPAEDGGAHAAPGLARPASRSSSTPAAASSSASCRERLEELRAQHRDARIVFLEASDEDLVQRYEATRRRHPLAPADRVVEGIRKERQILAQLRGDADLVIDTSGLTPARAPRPRARRVRRRAARGRPPGLASCRSASSTGPRATPTCCSTCGSCRTRIGCRRSARSPGHRPGGPGLRAEQARSIASFLERLEALLDVSLPGYVAEGKSYLTIAIGCTGGHHRSVVVAEELAAWIRARGLPTSRGAPRRRARMSPGRRARARPDSMGSFPTRSARPGGSLDQ